MTDGIVGRIGQRVRNWFTENAEHITVRFIEDHGATPLRGDDGYLRMLLVEGFLAKSGGWGNDYFPVLHGGVALRFLGNPSTPFTTFSRPKDSWTTAGAYLNFPLTELLPFSGGTVEVEAALYRAAVAGPLSTAVSLAGRLAALVGPPLTVAATIADKVSAGLDTILESTGDQPVLGVHWTMVSAGGGGHAVRSGNLAVVNMPEEKLDGTLSIVDGRLHVDRGDGAKLLDGVDFLLLRIECRTERDDWRLPDLDELINLARAAYLNGHLETFSDLRAAAISRAWSSRDLTARDGVRVAKLVADLVDEVKQFGALEGAFEPLSVVASRRLPAADSDELAGLTLVGLLNR